MPAFSADGQWIYFIRIVPGAGQVPRRRAASRTWYDLETPRLMRIKPDGTGRRAPPDRPRSARAARPWFYWLRQPVPSPDGKTIALISDGPNPLQSDIVLHSSTTSRRRS